MSVTGVSFPRADEDADDRGPPAAFKRPEAQGDISAERQGSDAPHGDVVVPAGATVAKHLLLRSQLRQGLADGLRQVRLAGDP